MLEIEIPESELWDSTNEQFVLIKEQTLYLEHSLVSISKWESKWHKPFLSKDDKTDEEFLDYIKCMTVTKNANPNVYSVLTEDHVCKIVDYINNPMTATWFSEKKARYANREQVTSELVYYWMIALGIPYECQKWHFNRLLTLIQVCNVKNSTKKKMSNRELMQRNAALNAKRKKELHTKG